MYRKINTAWPKAKSKYMHENEFASRNKRYNNGTERNKAYFCHEKGINVESIIAHPLFCKLRGLPRDFLLIICN